MKWINELDMLPAPFEKVICFGLKVECLGTFSYVDFAYMDDSRQWQTFAGTDADDWRITHWLPIPKEPKDD